MAFKVGDVTVTWAVAYVYLVALLCGISTLMAVNCVFSAPSYIMNYYKYASKNTVQVPVHKSFWDNVLSYYNLVSLVTGLICEPATLTPFFRRVPVLLRLYAGLLILIAEIVMIITVPAVGTTEVGAMITILLGGFISGFGKSIFESTVYGMFSTFHPSFISVMMSGVGISGVLTSFIQIIVKAAVEDSYDGVVMQSHIYYGLDIGIQAVTFISLVLMRFNSYAREQFGDLGGKTEKTYDAAQVAGQPRAEAAHADADAIEPANENAAGYCPKGLVVGEEYEGRHSSATSSGKKEGAVAAPATGDAAVITSSDLLQSTAIMPIFKLIYWMCIGVAFNFLITLMLFPTVVISSNPNDYWYGTAAVFIFNFADMIGRFAPTFKITWPTYGQRWIIVAASFARVIFLPLLLLHSYHYIKGDAFGYVMMVIFGLSNGYIGTMNTVLGPKTKGIDNDGKRFVAGTMMVIFNLVGCTTGTALSIMMQTIREKQA